MSLALTRTIRLAQPQLRVWRSTDSEVSRIRQVVASLVAPLPVFDLISVMDPTCSTDAAVPQGGDPPPPLGFLLIAIPRSTNAPHAVLVNDALRYPRRNGATIRYLSEPEVAAAYRDRIAGVETQAQRVLDVERQALARLDRSQEPWLLVTLTPDLPGDTVLTASAFNEFQRTVMGSQTAIVRAGVTYQRASVGRRRLLADGTMDPAVSSARYASLELHTDGAGAYGLQLYDMTSSRWSPRPRRPTRGGRSSTMNRSWSLRSQGCSHSLKTLGIGPLLGETRYCA